MVTTELAKVPCLSRKFGFLWFVDIKMRHYSRVFGAPVSVTRRLLTFLARDGLLQAECNISTSKSQQFLPRNVGESEQLN